MVAKFRILQAGQFPTVGEWNRLVQLVTTLQGIRGAAPINVSNIAGQPIVSIDSDVSRVELIKVYATDTNRGKYLAHLRDSPSAAPPVSGDLTDDMIGDADASIVHAWNMRETDGSGASEHIIDTSAKPIWFFGYRTTVADDGIQIYVFDGLQAVSGGTTNNLLGTVSAYTAGANNVTLTPLLGGSDIDVLITLPYDRTVCSIVDISVGNILSYTTTGAYTYLVSVPLPVSTTRRDVLQISGTAGSTGFGSVELK